MAAVEVYKSTGQAGMYAQYALEMFELASFFSASAHFNIIDSYTSRQWRNKPWAGGANPPALYQPYRYKGDPIADTEARTSGSVYPVWDDSVNDVGVDGSWIIVECQTEHPTLASMGYSGLPKWQCKFQVDGDTSYLADVSDPTGAKYPKNHNTRRIMTHRFGPYGGWDLEDSLPDFNPVSPPVSGDVSTGNHQGDGGNNSAIDVRWIMICADGVMMRLARYNNNPRQFYQIMEIIGDVIPVTAAHMPMPRCAFGNGTGHNSLLSEDNGCFLAAGNQYTNNNLDYSTVDNIAGGIAFWDHNESLVESRYSLDKRDHWQYSVHNPFPPTPELELFPISPIAIQGSPVGQYFSYPYVRRSWTRGTMLHKNKEWMSVGVGWSPLFAWDGSSQIY